MKSLQDVKAKHTGHWFDKSACRFFLTRFPYRDEVIPTPDGGCLFITSEKQPNSPNPRKASVRRAFPDGHIDTVGEFSSYKSPKAALVEARKLAPTFVKGKK